MEKDLKKLPSSTNNKNLQIEIENFLNYLKLKADLMCYEETFFLDLICDSLNNPKKHNRDSYSKISHMMMMTPIKEEEVINDDHKINMPSMNTTHKSKMIDDEEDLSNQEKKIYGLNGFFNIGNTCYLNSVLQCLINTKILSEFCLSDVPKMKPFKYPNLIEEFSNLVNEILDDTKMNKRNCFTYKFKSKIEAKNKKVLF